MACPGVELAVVVGGGVVGGRGGRGRRRRGPGQQLLELAVQPVLGLGVLEPGAPQLVGDEPEHQQAGGDEDLADGADHPAPVVGRWGSIPPRRGHDGPRYPPASWLTRRSLAGARAPGRRCAPARAGGVSIGFRAGSVAGRWAGRSSSWTDAVAVLGGFPALAGAWTSPSTSARSSCCAVPTAPARRRCCGCAPGCCRWPAAAARSSAAT